MKHKRESQGMIELLICSWTKNGWYCQEEDSHREASAINNVSWCIAINFSCASVSIFKPCFSCCDFTCDKRQQEVHTPCEDDIWVAIFVALSIIKKGETCDTRKTDPLTSGTRSTRYTYCLVTSTFRQSVVQSILVSHRKRGTSEQKRPSYY